MLGGYGKSGKNGKKLFEYGEKILAFFSHLSRCWPRRQSSGMSPGRLQEPRWCSWKKRKKYGHNYPLLFCGKTQGQRRKGMVRFLADFSRQKGGFYNRREGVYPPAKSPNTGWHDMGRKKPFLASSISFCGKLTVLPWKKFILTWWQCVVWPPSRPAPRSWALQPAKKGERRKINTNTYVKTPQKKKD